MTARNIICVALCAILLVLAPFARAANINVQPVVVQADAIEVTVTAAGDGMFEVAGEPVKARKLKNAIRAANGGKTPTYVLVDGEATVGDMLAVAEVGKRVGFTTLFVKAGEFRSIEVLD